MRKVVIFESLTLDGVMQAPGRPDEDPRGGFQHGGWAAPYSDPVMGSVAAEGMTQAPALLFGRRTYEDFASVWPNQPDNPFTAGAEQRPEVRGVDDAVGAAAVEQLHAPQGRRRGGCGQAQGAAWTRISWCSAAASWSSR